MENIENKSTTETSIFNLNEIKGFLFETAKWGKFIAIVGYVGMGIMIILGLLVMIGKSSFGQFTGHNSTVGILGIIYIIMAIIYYFPVTYLYKFSKQIRNGLLANDELSITTGFSNLKSLFKFTAILIIVMLAMYGVALVIGVGAYLFMS